MIPRPSATCGWAFGAALCLVAGAAGIVFAQQSAPAPGPGPHNHPPAAAPKPAPAPPPAAPKPQSDLPISLEHGLYLIRSTLLALNDANRTGNYTVLRDLAAADFQVKNTAADLALAFADLRRRKFDLFAAALLAPQLTAAPTIETNGMLRLKGLFPTRPLQIDFDLSFQSAGGSWRLYAIAVATVEPKGQAAAPAAR